MYASKGAAVRIGHGTMNWFKIRKGTNQSYILLPCLFNFCAENTMKKNKNLDETQVRNKIFVGDMTNLSYPNDKHWNDRRNIVIKAPLDESIICFKYRHLKWDSPP